MLTSFVMQLIRGFPGILFVENGPVATLSLRLRGLSVMEGARISIMHAWFQKLFCLQKRSFPLLSFVGRLRGIYGMRGQELLLKTAITPFFCYTFYYMVAVFTGNGKGKTTASLGQIMRAVGQKKKAIMFQFIKGPWISGEHKFLDEYKNLKGRLEIHRGGRGFVGILGDKLPFATHKEAARNTLKKAARAIRSKQWDVVVLDEVNVAVSLGLVGIRDVLHAIKDEPQNMIVILSGRGAPKSFLKRADLVTQMQEIKHPYARGKKAEVGFEF